MITIRQTHDFTKWFDGLRDRQATRRIIVAIDKMANGLFGDVKPVGAGISEVRIHYGPGYRLYFTRQGDSLVILLCGGDKSSQAADISKAKSIKRGLET